MKINLELSIFLSLALILFIQIIYAQQEVDLEKLKKQFAESETAAQKLKYGQLLSTKLRRTYSPQRLTYALKVLENAQALDSLDVVQSFESYISYIYYDYGDYEQALKYAIASLQTAKKLGDKSSEAGALSNIAYYNAELGDQKKAQKYAKKALQVVKNIKDLARVNAVYNNVAEVHYLLKQYDQAIKYLEKSLELNQKQEDPYSIAFAEMNLAHNYIGKNDYKTAFTYAVRAYKIMKESEDVLDLAFLSIDLGIIEREFGNFTQARKYLEEAKQIAEKANAKPQVANAYRELAELALQEQNFEVALEYYKKYTAYEDSIYNESRSRQVNLMQASLESTQQEYENKQLRQQNDLHLATIRNQQLLGLVMAILLISVVLLLFLLTRNSKQKRLTTHIIQQQNDALKAQNRQLMRLDQEKSDLMNIVAHDLKAPLNRVIGLIEILGHENPTASQQEYFSLITNVAAKGRNMIQELLDLQTFESQDFTLDISSIQLPNLFKNIILGFEQNAQKKNIKLGLETTNPEINIETDSILLERIMDNLISNAVKFSKPDSEIRVVLANTENDRVQIKVQDEGQGFSEDDKKRMFQKFTRLSAKPTAGEDSTGLGLYIVKLLVETLEGEISLQSELDKGSTFTISLPRNLQQDTISTLE